MPTQQSRENRSSAMRLAVVVMLVGAVMRLIPHPDNVTPLVAIAFFGGTIFSGAWALIVPVAAIIASDALLGFHATIAFTWGSVLLIALLGLWVRGKPGWRRIVGGSLASSTLFFLVTNFGVWLMGHAQQWYPRTWAGLVECYTLAAPFYRQALLGDLAYVGLLFGAYHLAAARLTRPATAPVSTT